VLTERAGMDGFLHNGGIEADTTEICDLCYWLVILRRADHRLQYPRAHLHHRLLGRVVLFVPKVMVALLILGLRRVFRALHRQRGVGLLQERAHPDADLLGRLAQYAILTFLSC